MTSMYIWRTDDRPTDLATWKISNGHISATKHPIQFMFGSTVEYSGSADQMTLLPVGPKPRWWPAAILVNFKWPYLSNGIIGFIRLLVVRVFRVSGSNGATYSWRKSKMAAGHISATGHTIHYSKSIGKNNAQGVIRLVTI